MRTFIFILVPIARHSFIAEIKELLLHGKHLAMAPYSDLIYSAFNTVCHHDDCINCMCICSLIECYCWNEKHSFIVWCRCSNSRLALQGQHVVIGHCWAFGQAMYIKSFLDNAWDLSVWMSATPTQMEQRRLAYHCCLYQWQSKSQQANAPIWC